MNAAIICRDFPPAISGLGDHTFFTAREMAARGENVTVITSSASVVADTSFVVRSVIPGWDRKHIGAILAEVDAADADVVFLQYVPHMYGRSGVAAWIVKLARRIKEQGSRRLVVVFHEICYPWSLSKRLPIRMIHKFQATRLVSIADASVITTRSRLETMRRWLPRFADRMCEIPVGSNIPVVDVSDERIEEIRGLYMLQSGPLIGGFGSLKLDERSFGLLCRAVAIARRHAPMLRFVWIGGVDYEGSDYKAVCAMAERLGVRDAFVWTGPLPPEAVSEHLTALDLFLSLQDGGPCFRRGSLVAAMAHGLPIIAMEGEGADARLCHGREMLILPASPERIGEQIVELVGSADTRSRLRSAARAFHDAHLGWGKIVDQLMAVSR